jgi:hypothetical protein
VTVLVACISRKGCISPTMDWASKSMISQQYFLNEARVRVFWRLKHCTPLNIREVVRYERCTYIYTASHSCPLSRSRSSQPSSGCNKEKVRSLYEFQRHTSQSSTYGLSMQQSDYKSTMFRVAWICLKLSFFCLRRVNSRVNRVNCCEPLAL